VGMQDDEAFTVGRFAMLTGLTAHTLRHYDAVGLLHPADVDPDTGYRRYSREQMVVARLIKDLRWLDLPIDQVRQVLAAPHSADARAALAAHADRLRRQRRHISQRLQQCTRYALRRRALFP
jgi:DNA-binding transcriptional MerR regulator